MAANPRSPAGRAGAAQQPFAPLCIAAHGARRHGRRARPIACLHGRAGLVASSGRVPRPASPRPGPETRSRRGLRARPGPPVSAEFDVRVRRVSSSEPRPGPELLDSDLLPRVVPSQTSASSSFAERGRPHRDRLAADGGPERSDGPDESPGPVLPSAAAENLAASPEGVNGITKCAPTGREMAIQS